MANALQAVAMGDNGEKRQLSESLAKSLAQAAKSLSTRPNGLRGPFVVKASVQTEKKK